MASPQKVKYKDVEDLLFQLPENELVIVQKLRGIILNTLPQVREKLAYNVPFYYLQKRFAYIWPAHVPWGGIKKGVVLGFTSGNKFAHQSLFKATDHKQIRQLVFHKPSEIDEGLIKTLLLEAKELDHF